MGVVETSVTTTPVHQYVEHIDNIQTVTPPPPFPSTSSSSTESKEIAPYAEHGAGIDHQITQDEAVPARPDLWWSRQRRRFREPLSEFFGVFILILFGDGVVAQVVLSKGGNGAYQSITWGWGYVASVTVIVMCLDNDCVLIPA